MNDEFKRQCEAELNSMNPDMVDFTKEMSIILKKYSGKLAPFEIAGLIESAKFSILYDSQKSFDKYIKS